MTNLEGLIKITGVQLPETLRQAIEETVEGLKPSELARAAAELSTRYRAGRPPRGGILDSEILRIAYLATRLPATWAVLRSVFEELRRLMPDLEIRSLLDLGCGPGTALWAAAGAFEDLREATLCDSVPELIRLGKELARGATGFPDAKWQVMDLRGAQFTPHQLVVCSYSLGELGIENALGIVRKAWDAAGTGLVIVEPGTRRGFGLVRDAREVLIELGASLLAPCPHERACPMGDGDWCHFSARLERTALHRYLKMGEHGYEDEKYSYLIALRQPGRRVPERVIRHPRRHSGFVQLTLCGETGIEQLTVTRSEKDLWRKARKIGWGDEWEGA